jgi:RNA polymerase sigma-54 factor
MKQSLQLKLHQQLTLTPQLQQSIRLLQLSTLELGQEISQMLQDNPLLERLDGEDSFEGPTGDAPADETARQERDDVYEEMAWGDRAVGPAHDDDDDEHGFQQAGVTSLREYLSEQLGLTQLSNRDRQLVAFLIEALDDDGYLSASLDELAEMLPEELEIDPLELSAALHILQSFDPIGIGARNLGECLWLQLNAMPPDTPHLNAARSLARDHLVLLADREYGKLKRLLGLEESAFIQLRQLITSLEPRPGASYAPADTRYVVPDVFVKKLKGFWVTSLNANAVPKLRINELYAGILRGNRDGGSSLSTQLQEARWLIKNVQQRFETILKVSQAIVDRQRMFFEHGEVAMRPLTLREIADTVELHESTISRVTTQKFMMTPRGLYEFKYFFGSSLSTDEGGSASSTAMRALIKQFIDAENRARPLSDSAISELLGKQGFVVARRTVAKYRELLNIPPANQRKSM